MDDKPFTELLKNYTAFIERVDAHIKGIEKKYPDHIACKKGCDSCCRYLNLFPVEAFALAAAFVQSSIHEQDRIIASMETSDDTCPLLINHSCSLYLNRPIICRTHGYPIFMADQENSYIDFCPKNFKGFTTFPKDVLLSIEQLNTTLTAINRYFLESIETQTPLPERIPISTALLLLSGERK